jgi:hypothetical protein
MVKAINRTCTTPTTKEREKHFSELAVLDPRFYMRVRRLDEFA